MRPTAKRIEDYRRCVDQALGWIRAHQEPDGSFGAVEAMSHVMLTGCALLYGGYPAEAARLMGAIRRDYLRADGALDPPEVRAGRTSALLERGYAPSWVVYSAHVNLALDISLRAMPHVLRFQDPGTGGMFGREEEARAGRGIVNTAVTCVAGEAALVTGYVAEALRMGDHLVDNVLAHNPDLSRAFFPVWDTERGLRTDADAPVSGNMPRVLVRDQAEQHHFLTGMLLGLLVDLHRVSGRVKYLDAAVALYDFAAGGNPAVYRSTASHKFAWGCAWLFGVTGKAEHLESACRMCDYLVEIQESDGSWVHWAFVKSAADWPYSPRLNITSQFALWINRTLALL